VLPAAGVGDRRAAPDPGGAVEIEEAPGAAARPVLHDEVPVEHDRLHLGEQRVAAVDVAPAGLHHPHLRLVEVAERLLQHVRRRHEVRVEDQHELAGRAAQPGVEGARLVAGAVVAVQVVDVEALRAVVLHRAAGDGARLVGRVVEDLDLQQLLRVADGRHRGEQAVDDVHLVEDRQLDGDPWQPRGQRAGQGFLVLVAEVEPDHHVAVEAEDGQDHERQEVEPEDPQLQNAHDADAPASRPRPSGCETRSRLR